MNGRIYDFNVGRFLSVDPFLQFPENSQSANPYSYILNNPMSGTDPTGYAATGGSCSTGSNTGFEGFCTSVQLADTESKKKNKAKVDNGEKNESNEAKRVNPSTDNVGKSANKQNPSYGNNLDFMNGYGKPIATNDWTAENTSLLIGLTPVGTMADFYTAFTGKDLFTSENVSGIWRWAGLIPFANEARKIENLAETAKESITFARQADVASNFGKTSGSALSPKLVMEDPKNLIPTQAKSEMTGSQVKRLTKDMKQNGFDLNKPVDVWRNPHSGRLEIQDGHHRTEAAMKAGLDQIPVQVWE